LSDCTYSSPLISVIVAVYNGGATLQQCIDSFAQQTYDNKELIIIDGGSVDETVELIKANQEQITYWISETDRGIYHAWNKGLSKTHGKWICFLGADDYFWNDTVLERMVAELIKLPDNVLVAYGKITQIDTEGKPLVIIGEPWEKIKSEFTKNMCMPHVGAMHRQSIFEQYGKFDESFHIAGDYELLLRCLKFTDAQFLADIVVAGQRAGGVSTNGTNYFLTRQEVRRAQRMHGYALPFGLLVKELAKDYLQLLLWKVAGEKLARKILDQRRKRRGLPPFWTRT
jgi:glycosyltransferase involved in cell wall biosynthesis